MIKMRIVIPRATTEKEVQTDIGREGEKGGRKFKWDNCNFLFNTKEGVKEEQRNKKDSDWCKANSTNNYIKCG